MGAGDKQFESRLLARTLKSSLHGYCLPFTFSFLCLTSCHTSAYQEQQRAAALCTASLLSHPPYCLPSIPPRSCFVLFCPRARLLKGPNTQLSETLIHGCLQTSPCLQNTRCTHSQRGTRLRPITPSSSARWLCGWIRLARPAAPAPRLKSRKSWGSYTCIAWAHVSCMRRMIHACNVS